MQAIETLADENVHNVAINNGPDNSFPEMVGCSSCLKAVLEQAKSVARTDAAVLILGETGTGKELVAKAIHRLSPRREQAFVRANCASIPPGLIESELFGHEKGHLPALWSGRSDVLNWRIKEPSFLTR